MISIVLARVPPALRLCALACGFRSVVFSFVTVVSSHLFFLSVVCERFCLLLLLSRRLIQLFAYSPHEDADRRVLLIIWNSYFFPPQPQLYFHLSASAKFLLAC